MVKMEEKLRTLLKSKEGKRVMTAFMAVEKGKAPTYAEAKVLQERGYVKIKHRKVRMIGVSGKKLKRTTMLPYYALTKEGRKFKRGLERV